MGDVFKEQLVKRKLTTIDTLKKVGLVFAGVLIAFILMILFGTLTVFIDIGIFFGIYYLFTFLNVEYEYVYTNGELDIDAIYSRSKRKRIFSMNVKEFEIMTHASDKEHENKFSNIKVTKDYSSGVINENTYTFITTYKGEKMKVIFEPNQAIQDSISTILSPRKFIKKI